MIKTIPLTSLRPNPYRELDKYYYDEDVIQELMESMDRNGVWAGIRARQAGDVYEIAFGHHRLEAMKRLNVKEAIVDVQKIDDLHMITEMADENMADKRPNTKGITNVVGAAKKKLEEMLSGIETWKAARADTRCLFDGEAGFKQFKGKSGEVGSRILERFLGTRWSNNIKEALALIAKSDAGVLNLKAAQLFDSPTHAAVFAETVEELKIPKAEQEKKAKEIIKSIKADVSEADREKGRRGNLTSDSIRDALEVSVFGDAVREMENEKIPESERLRRLLGEEEFHEWAQWAKARIIIKERVGMKELSGAAQKEIKKVINGIRMDIESFLSDGGTEWAEQKQLTATN